MKHLEILALVVGAVFSFGAPGRAQSGTRVLVFVRDGSSEPALMIAEEVNAMISVLHDANIAVDVATLGGGALDGLRPPVPTRRLADVHVSDYAAVMLPCMAAGAATSPEAVALVKEAAAAGRLIAAQNNAVRIVARAGVLAGRKFAMAVEPDDMDQDDVRGATYAGTGVIRDGSLITAGICPAAARNRELHDTTADLTRAVVAAVQRAR